MDKLKKALEDELLLFDLKADSLESVFHAAIRLIVERGRLPAEESERVYEALLQREEQVSTAIGHAVAVPHAYLDCLDAEVMVFVRLERPLNLGAPDGIATRFLFVLLGPPGAAAEHLDSLTVIARLMSDEQFRYDAAVAQNSRQLLAAVDRFEARIAPLPPKERREIPAGLRYTGRLFGGMLNDLRRRLPHYVSDFRDGLHPKCLSSTLFLFFACLAPAVTFGGLMAEYTGNQIGSVEMLVATAVCGTIYALLSGHPLIILGGTGPLLIFTMILYRLCEEYNVEFLAAYGWVGIWMSVFLLILAAVDASCLMRFFTRFTDEIFAVLNSLIFIVAAVDKLAASFDVLEEHRHHATAVLTLLLALGTLYIAHTLSQFRRSRYLLPWMREFLSDFGLTIAIACMTLVALWLSDVELKRIVAPDRLVPTHQVTVTQTNEAGVVVREQRPRNWLVSLTDVPGWVPLAAIIPALLGTALAYIVHNITARLINSPDHKLKKGEAYHYDLAVTGGLIGFCSLFGLPWLVAATVRSLNHVRSLATVEEVVNSGGETRERIIHVRENRLTGLGIHLLVGLSLLLLSYLKDIPMAVLYGLFLFMGLVSMKGNQFVERMSLWLMDRNLYPSTHYIRTVPNRVIHQFTLIQFLCLAVMCAVEVGPPLIAILFPLFVVLLVPVRLLLNRFFSAEYLAILDAEEEPEEEETHWTV